jgi:hypothetical protein
MISSRLLDFNPKKKTSVLFKLGDFFFLSYTAKSNPESFPLPVRNSTHRVLHVGPIWLCALDSGIEKEDIGKPYTN